MTTKKPFWSKEALSRSSYARDPRPKPVRSDQLKSAQMIHDSVVKSRRIERSIASGLAFRAAGATESCTHCGQHESVHLWRCLNCGHEAGTGRPPYCTCGAMTATGERLCPPREDAPVTP